MAEECRRSAAGMVMDVVETAVLSALGAAGLAAVATAVIAAVFVLPPSATGPGPFWALPALTAATGLGATAGAVLAARGRPVAPFPWIVAAAAGLAVNIGLGFVLGVRAPGFGVFFEYTSALTFVVLLPIAGAVTIHSLLRLRTRTVRGFTRVVLVVLAAGVGVVSYRGVAIPGVPLARGDFARITVATDGRLYLWTGKPTIETADPDRLEWQRLRPVPGARSVGFVLPVPEAPGYLVAGTGESLWQYTPATQQWGRVVEVIPGNAFTTGAAASHGIYIVDRFGSLHVMSSDRGNAWERRTIAVVGKGRLTFQHIAVSQDRPGLVLGGCQYQNGLIRTTDYGDSWESLELPKEPGTSFVPSVHDIAFLPADPPQLLVLLNHGLFASSDGGETWVGLETPEDWLSGGELAVAATSPPTIYLHAGLDLYASDDLGKTWWNTGVHSISDRQGIITDIAVDPSSPSRAYAARTGSLHRTEDGGRTWSQIR